MSLYQGGRYEEAITEFKAAYAVQQLPRLLYNMGRAHFQLGHAREALDLYKKYLSLERSPPAEYRRKVEENMAQAQAMLDVQQELERKAAPAPAAPRVSPAAPGVSPATAGVPPPAAGVPGAAPDAPPATPDAPPAAGVPAATPESPARPGKAGPFMVNLRMGPALPLVIGNGTTSMAATSLPVELAAGLEIGFALNAARTAYLTIPLQAQFEMLYGTLSGVWIMLPVAFQYDIGIRAAPGLYLYPRLTAGYAVLVGPGSDALHQGMIIPEFGIKYVIKRRVNLALEPVGVPLFFTSQVVTVFYRLTAQVGVNF